MCYQARQIQRACTVREVQRHVLSAISTWKWKMKKAIASRRFATAKKRNLVNTDALSTISCIVAAEDNTSIRHQTPFAS